MKLIGLDVGTRRIGVAIADSSVRIAVPKGTIVVNGGREFQEIIRIAKLNNTEWFVIGMPRSNQGNRTAQSGYVQDFADALLRVFPAAKIRFQDESLTSVEAEERLKARKRRYGKEEIDAEAAAIILQDFIENFKNTTQTSATPSATATPPEAKPKQSKTKKAKDTPMIKKTFYAILSVIIIVGIFSFIAYGWYNAALEPVVDDMICTAFAPDPRQDKCKTTDFTVEEGDTVQKIASKLKQGGLIKSSIAFHIYARTHKIADQLQVGKYELTSSMSTPEIAVALVEGGSSDNVFSFTIYPGETIKDIKEDLINHGYNEDEVNQAFAKKYDHPVLEGRPEVVDGVAEPLEGYLFGDTYEFYKGESVEKIITTALDEFYQAIQKENLIERLASRGFSLYDGITLASIIQKEANTKDFPTVSQIFQSRLDQGISLGSDVTVQYALNIVDPKREVYTDNTTAVEIDSPYNTRRYAGLTPGPISNPSIQALISVAEPSDTGYLYFLTGDDGMMYYGNTEEEHLRNIQEYCQNFCANSL